MALPNTVGWQLCAQGKSLSNGVSQFVGLKPWLKEALDWLLWGAAPKLTLHLQHGRLARELFLLLAFQIGFIETFWPNCGNKISS